MVLKWKEPEEVTTRTGMAEVVRENIIELCQNPNTWGIIAEYKTPGTCSLTATYIKAIAGLFGIQVTRRGGTLYAMYDPNKAVIGG